MLNDDKLVHSVNPQLYVLPAASAKKVSSKDDMIDHMFGGRVQEKVEKIPLAIEFGQLLMPRRLKSARNSSRVAPMDNDKDGIVVEDIAMAQIALSARGGAEGSFADSDSSSR